MIGSARYWREIPQRYRYEAAKCDEVRQDLLPAAARLQRVPRAGRSPRSILAQDGVVETFTDHPRRADRLRRPGALCRRDHQAGRRRQGDGPDRRLRSRDAGHRGPRPAGVPAHPAGRGVGGHLLRVQVRSGGGISGPSPERASGRWMAPSDRRSPGEIRASWLAPAARFARRARRVLEGHIRAAGSSYGTI